ncbi:hypothetical protein [Actinokineospora sp. NBRC 105648]|nr:hypothetical protein [Actinokineospora sp. NBRC 105648]
MVSHALARSTLDLALSDENRGRGTAHTGRARQTSGDQPLVRDR